MFQSGNKTKPGQAKKACSIIEVMGSLWKNNYVDNEESDQPVHSWFFFYIFFFDFGFYCPFKNISLISSWSFITGGQKPENPGGKTTWPSVSRTWPSHMWPEQCSNHSGESTSLSTRLRGLLCIPESDQNFLCPFTELLNTVEYINSKWWDCMDMKEDLNLHITHMFIYRQPGPSCSKRR